MIPTLINKKTPFKVDTEIIVLTDQVISVRDNIFFTTDSTNLKVSTNHGGSYQYTQSFADADVITGARIFKNGNILFMTWESKLYLTDTTLSSITEKFMYEEDGVTLYDLTGEVRAFTPVSYMNYNHPQDWFLWTNYTNVPDTGTTVNIYMTDDSGENMRIAYQFSGAEFDAPRHGHICEYNPWDDEWVVTLGDTPPNGEIFWMKGIFSGGSWTWENLFPFTINAGSEFIRLKTNGLFFRIIKDITYVYWSVDSNNDQDASGIFRCKWNDIKILNAHQQVLDFKVNDDLGYYSSNMKVDSRTGLVLLVVGEQGNFTGNERLCIVEDWGHGDYELRFFSNLGFIAINDMSAKGYFRLNTNILNPTQNGTYLIKVGQNLFKDL